MAGPYTLDRHGEEASFPTWGGGKTTRFTIRCLDPNHYGGVHINAGGASEDVGVGGGEAKSIDRQWGGLMISVSNNRADRAVAVEVSTA